MGLSGYISIFLGLLTPRLSIRPKRHHVQEDGLKSSVRNGVSLLMGILMYSPLWCPPVQGHQASSLYQEAVVSANQGNLEQAQSLLSEAIEEFPGFWKAHHLSGLVTFQLTQQMGPAVEALKKAISLNPHLVQARYDLALFLINQKKYPEAKNQLQAALQSYPRFWEAQLLLGQILQQHSASHEAIAAFQKVLEQHPTQPDALFSLAYEYHQEKNRTQAKPYFQN